MLFSGRANDYDRHKLKELVEKDLSKGIEVGTITADKGYDDVITIITYESYFILMALNLKRLTRQKIRGVKGSSLLSAVCCS